MILRITCAVICCCYNSSDRCDKTNSLCVRNTLDITIFDSQFCEAIKSGNFARNGACKAVMPQCAASSKPTPGVENIGSFCHTKHCLVTLSIANLVGQSKRNLCGKRASNVGSSSLTPRHRKPNISAIRSRATN